jgi:hypothetical protein
VLRAVGQLVGTSVFDYAAWVVLLALFTRLLRTGEARWWVHDWAMFEFFTAVREDEGGLGGRIEFVYRQLLISGIVTVVVWGPGLVWLLRGRARFRPLAYACLATVGLLLVAGGKFYYAAPVHLALPAAGCVALTSEPARSMRGRVVTLAVAAVLSAPLAMPVLPADALGAVIPIQKELGEMVAGPSTWPRSEEPWPVRRRVRSCSPPTTAKRPCSSATHRSCACTPATTPTGCGARLAARITNDAGLDNDENGAPIWVCDRLVAPWPQLWPSLKRYE